MSNSRSWQRLCVLPGEMRASPRPGKAIGSFESRTKDFLSSGPREGEKRGVFVCMERVACSWEESCPGCLGGRMSASEGQAFVLEKRALSSSSAAHGCASPPSPPLSCLSCQVLPALLVALSPTPGHSVTASLPAAKLLAQEGEAGGCFPLPDLIVELPCWKTLASSVSHTSAHPLLPWVSKVLCGKPEHLLCELGSWRRVGRDVLPALQ